MAIIIVKILITKEIGVVEDIDEQDVDSHRFTEKELKEMNNEEIKK